MATISKLNVILSATTAKFHAGMKRAIKPLRAMREAVTKTTKRVGLMGAAMTAAAAAGLVLITKRSLENIDALAKLSDRIGIATEDLQTLRHAAGLTGSSAAAMDKSLETLTRRLGEAAVGSGEATRGLEMLGLSAEDLMKKSPARAFEDIAEQIVKLDTKAEQAAAAYYLLGRAGIQMLNTLRLGKKGLQDARDDIDKVGAAISRMDAAKVENANDALRRLWLVLTDIGNKIAIELSVYIEAAAEKLIDMAAASGGAGGIISRSMDMAIEAVRALGNTLGETQIAFLRLQQSALTGYMVFADIARDLMETFSFTGKWAQWRAVAWENSVQDAASAIGALEDKIKSLKKTGPAKWGDDWANSLLAIKKAAEATAQAIVNAMGGGGGGSDETPQPLEGNKGLRRLLKEGLAIAKSLRTPMEIYEDTITQLDKVLEVGGITWELYARGVEKARKALEATAKTAAKIELPQALVRGSSAEISFRHQTEASKGAGNVQGQQLAEAKETNAWQKEIAKFLKNMRDDQRNPPDFIGR